MNYALHIYRILLQAYGHQGWWPVTRQGMIYPEYGISISHAVHRFEIAMGAILTQNTTWKNAERALVALHLAGIYAPKDILHCKHEQLASLIRSAGYYNQKAKRLFVVARFFQSTTFSDTQIRSKLLALHGVGPETADSILLYAAEQPYFIIDTYTKRIFSRLGYLAEEMSYDAWQHFFHCHLPKSVFLFQEYHALLVEHAKRFCTKKPHCTGCGLFDVCKRKC